MDEARYRKIVRACAGYDLLLSVPFVLPMTFSWLLQGFGELQQRFDLHGGLPVFEPFHMLFANLMGAMLLVWALLRIIRPEPVLGLCNAIGCTLFFAIEIYYLTVQGITGLAWPFAISELVAGSIQYYGYWSYSKSRIS